MGATGSQVMHNALAQVSPWTTQVRVENKCTTQVLIYLARNAAEPSAADAIEHLVPASSTYAFNSGWLHEPRATLLIRTAVNEAKVIKITDTGRLMITLAPHGLHIESPDEVVIEDFHDPASVPGCDTVPMMMRGETFTEEAAQPAASRTASDEADPAIKHSKAPAPQADEQMEDLEAAAEDSRSSEPQPPAALRTGVEAREVAAACGAAATAAAAAAPARGEGAAAAAVGAAAAAAAGAAAAPAGGEEARDAEPAAVAVVESCEEPQPDVPAKHSETLAAPAENKVTSEEAAVAADDGSKAGQGGEGAGSSGP